MSNTCNNNSYNNNNNNNSTLAANRSVSRLILNPYTMPTPNLILILIPIPIYSLSSFYGWRTCVQQTQQQQQ